MTDIEERIFEAVDTLGDLATGPVISGYVDRAEGYVYTVLSRMVKEGKLYKGGYGRPYNRRGLSKRDKIKPQKSKSAPPIEERIFDAIDVLGNQATGPAIARYIEKSEGYVFTVLSRMIREGDLAKAGHGGPYVRNGAPRSLVEALAIWEHMNS